MFLLFFQLCNQIYKKCKVIPSLKNVHVLLRTMEDNILKDKTNGGPTQFIIFVKTIEVAKRLSEILKIKAYNCESLTGKKGKAS